MNKITNNKKFKKQFLKTVLSLVMVFVILSIFNLSKVVFATGDFSQIKQNVKPTNTGDSHIANASTEILSIIQVVFAIIAIVYTIILGIKLALGQADSKADVKNGLIALVIGAILVFLPVSVAKLILTFSPKNA